MKPTLIRDEVEYEAALGRIAELMDAEVGSPEAERLDALVTAVEAYEERVYPIGPPAEVDGLKGQIEAVLEDQVEEVNGEDPGALPAFEAAVAVHGDER